MRKLALILLSSIGLYGQWITGFYAAQNGVLPISAIPWDKYTHIIHFAAAPNSDGTVDLHYLTQAEISSITASRPAGKKMIVAIKDNDSNLNAFPAATSSRTIATFVSNIVDFVNNSGYDGVDIDWEANVNVTQYQDLLNRLRGALPGKVIVMDAGNWGGLESVAARAASALDQVNVMCYDMDSPSVGYSWFNDALLQNGNSSLMTCDWRVRSLTNAGLSAGKIGIGIPYYGRRWSGVTQPLVTGNFQTSYFRYGDLVTDGTRWQPQNKFYDSGHKGNYLSIPSLNEFDSYNGVEFIQDAVAWQKAQGFGGFMTFTVDYEYLPNQTGDAQHPLSTTLYYAVFGAAPPPDNPGPLGSSSLPPGMGRGPTTLGTVPLYLAVALLIAVALVVGLRGLANNSADKSEVR
jgi:chitinase